MSRAPAVVFMVSGVAILFAVIFVLFAPEDRVNLVRETWRGIVDPRSQACVDFVRTTADDPASLRLQSTEPAGDSHVRIVYTTRNAFGGTVSLWTKCAFNGKRVNERETWELMRPYLVAP